MATGTSLGHNGAKIALPPANSQMEEVTLKPTISTQLLTSEIHIGWLDSANDPSAGSPTETLLRLLLPLSDKVHKTFRCNVRDPNIVAVRMVHRITQSVGATGGVYKGQGRNQHELMTRAY